MYINDPLLIWDHVSQKLLFLLELVYIKNAGRLTNMVILFLKMNNLIVSVQQHKLIMTTP